MITINKSWFNISYIGSLASKKLTIGDTIIYSVWLDNTNSSITRGNSYAQIYFYDINDQLLTTNSGNQVYHGESKLSVVMAQVPAGTVSFRLAENTNNMELNTSAGMRKLEKGTILTPWSLAPEDDPTSIESRLAALENAVKGS
ncbi:hypothetical protein ACFQ4L_10370 [Lapidilactobacillus mulanensis]|uniref:Uncharacterized protein n=2 Tax=Lapidilactobacillus mulanensis TaxID=2485999 RepID=A0ABW4DU28_9LACO